MRRIIKISVIAFAVLIASQVLGKPKAYVITGWNADAGDKKAHDEIAKEAKKDLEQAGYEVIVITEANAAQFKDAVNDPNAKALVFIDHGAKGKERVGLKAPNGDVETVNGEDLNDTYDNFDIVTIHACDQNQATWRNRFHDANFFAWTDSVYPSTELAWQKEKTYPDANNPQPGTGTITTDPNLTEGQFLEEGYSEVLAPTNPVAGNWPMDGRLASAFGDRIYNFRVCDNDLANPEIIFGVVVSDGVITEYDIGDGYASPDFKITMTYNQYIAAVRNSHALLGNNLLGNTVFIDDIAGTGIDANILFAGVQRNIFFVTKPWPQAWNPQPANNATNVHYKTTDGNSITLSWSPSDDAIQHDVYFGTSFATVNSATTASPEYKGSRYNSSGDPCNWTIAGFNFKVNTAYYWRIDETNGTYLLTKGPVWKFTTHDGKAYNPKPINGATALSEPLQLSWTAGDWAASTNGHKVYFTTVAHGGNLANPLLPRPTDSQYRGQQTGTTYSLTNLIGYCTLVPGTTYYWCVDEVNTSNPLSPWKGPLWSFTPADYVSIDDFEDYKSVNDVTVNWSSGYEIPACGYGYGCSQIGFVRIGTNKYMQYTYHDDGEEPHYMYFSEARRDQSSANWTGSGVLADTPRVLQIEYRGAASNAVDPTYDRMYVAVEDSSGNVGIIQNPDPDAALVADWTKWFIILTDFNSFPNSVQLKLSEVDDFYIGFGVRCNYYMPGGDGNVMFDNIRLYAHVCNPAFRPTADMDEDCDVDIDDLKFISLKWLTADTVADIYLDGIVDFRDFAVLADHWITEQFWP
jgi:hypothetical protein